MKSERKDFILDKIRREKKIKAQEIVQEFNVTMETVRRDLEELEEMGKIQILFYSILQKILV